MFDSIEESYVSILSSMRNQRYFSFGFSDIDFNFLLNENRRLQPWVASLHFLCSISENKKVLKHYFDSPPEVTGEEVFNFPYEEAVNQLKYVETFIYSPNPFLTITFYKSKKGRLKSFVSLSPRVSIQRLPYLCYCYSSIQRALADSLELLYGSFILVSPEADFDARDERLIFSLRKTSRSAMPHEFGESSRFLEHKDKALEWFIRLGKNKDFTEKHQKELHAEFYTCPILHDSLFCVGAKINPSLDISYIQSEVLKVAQI